jgi:hypothetical protein
MLEPSTRAFYVRILSELNDRQLPYMVGGAYALRHHTGINRETRDLDLFATRADIERILGALAAIGYRTELTYAHWLGKVYSGSEFIDVIFSSGNGVATVDQSFLERAPDGVLFDVPIKWCPVEEMIWSKAFVMERERYDGADVAHLIHACSASLDWQLLVERFDQHWRVLLNHVVLFGFIYPNEQALIPTWVVHSLTERLRRDAERAHVGEPICGGTLLSRAQFLTDIREWGYRDGRLTAGAMNENEIAAWTAAIPGNGES